MYKFVVLIIIVFHNLIVFGQYYDSIITEYSFDNSNLDSLIIKGQLISYNDSLPLVGASILITNKIGFTTDINGNFYLELPINLVDSIRFEYITFRPLTISSLPKIQKIIDLNTIYLFESKQTVIIDGYFIASWWRILHNMKARKYFKKHEQENKKANEQVNKVISNYRYTFRDKFYKIDTLTNKIDLNQPIEYK